MQIDLSLPKDKRIILAAEAVFAKKGYEKATLDEIIAVADVGKGTVYKYFGNKEQLFYKLVAEKNAPFVEELSKVVAQAETIEAKLLAYFKVMVEFYRTNCSLWQIIYFEMFNDGQCTLLYNEDDKPQVVSRYGNEDVAEEVRERYLRYHELLFSEFNILKKILEDGIKQQLLKKSNARISGSHLFFGIAMGIFHHTHTVNKEGLSNDEIANIIVDRFLYGESR